MSAVSMAPGSPEIGTSECDDGDVDSTPQDACAKAPDHFGAGEGGEVVQYTEYIDNAKKTKTLQSGFEPQMNGDVGPGPAVASREGQERPSSVANATAYPKANQAVQSKVPKFGAWEGGDENYTVYFDKARDSKHSGDSSDTPRNYGRAPWIRDLFVDSRQHQPSIHEDAYGGGNRTTYDQIPLGNESQANVAATPRNLPEQKPTKQKKGRRFYWFRRRSGRERNAVP